MENTQQKSDLVFISEYLQKLGYKTHEDHSRASFIELFAIPSSAVVGDIGLVSFRFSTITHSIKEYTRDGAVLKINAVSKWNQN